jgi:antitoxin ParD1/3/4
MTLVLPDDLNRFLETEASAGGYADSGEYVREILRAFWKEMTRTELEDKLIAAMESGPAIEATPAFWAELRARVHGHAKASRP